MWYRHTHYVWTLNLINTYIYNYFFITNNDTKTVNISKLQKHLQTELRPFPWWLGGLLVERRTSVSQIRGSIPGQVAAV